MIEKLLGLIPLPVKIGGIAVAAAFIFGGGVKVGLWWNADDLKECESVVDDIERINYALEKENERIKLDSEKVTRDVSERWADVVAFNKRNPSIVRVRQDCSGQGGLSSTASSTSGLNATVGIEALSATGITSKECETQLKMGYRDASRLEFLIDWINQQHQVSTK